MSVNEVRPTKSSIDFEVRGEGGAATFCIGNEDHTLANALRHVLMNSADTVEFAGYSVPHPSEPVVQIRVQTIRQEHEARKLAAEALSEACHTLEAQCQHVLNKLEEILPQVKEDRRKTQAHLAAYAEQTANRERQDEDMEQED